MVWNDFDNPPTRDWRPRIAAGLAFVLSIGWLAVLGASRWPSLLDGATLDEAVALIGQASSPLILIALGYVMAVRTSRSEAARLARLSGDLRGEQARLEAVLASVSTRLEAERAEVAAQADQLLTIGDDAATRLRAVGDGLRGEIEALGTRAEALRVSASGARGDIQTLLGDLPRVQADTLAIRETLDAAGLVAHEHAAALDAQVASLVARGREADEVAGGAAQKLAAQLGRIDGVSATAGERMVAVADTMTGAIDAALARSADASDAARRGMDAQGAAMLALVEAGEAALMRTGADATDAVAARVADVSARIEAMGAHLHAHYAAGAEVFDGLSAAAGALQARLSAVDTENNERAHRMSGSLAALTTDATTLGNTLVHGDDYAAQMIARVEALRTTLVALIADFDRSLPEAFGRIDEHIEATTGRLAAIAPAIDQVEQGARAAATAIEVSDTRLITATAMASALAGHAAAIDASTRALAESTGPQMVEALVQVRDTAQAAAVRARAAIEDAIPDAAVRLRDTISAAATAEIEAQIAELGATASRAVASASAASDRLMRQMLTIAETSAQVEVRIAEAHSEIEDADSDGFARRVALLIESLNSTAIDVSRIMATDVSDATWAAYLKGDRGAFTRRAVRLLDAGQAREIARHYNEDSEFREQVNRYVHDFEAMLRNVLANRSGSPMGVALLSSDMGKLYVALAQAIERLRS